MSAARGPRRGRKTIRLVIADDHELARSGLRSMVMGERGVELVGEAADGSEALELCRELQPDVALLDVRMPRMDGVAATHAIKEACPNTVVLLVTMHASPDYLLEAMRAGAAGYLLKDASRQELLDAIRRAVRGEMLLNGETSAHLLRRMAGDIPRPATAAIERLTERERDVLKLLAAGHTNREIVQQLGLSLGAVKAHIEHIIVKLGVSDRAQAAVRATESGLLDVSAS